MEVPVDPDKRRNAFQNLRGIHQNRASFILSQAEIFSGGGIAGEGFTGGVAPGGGVKEFARAVVEHFDHGLTRKSRQRDEKQSPDVCRNRRLTRGRTIAEDQKLKLALR
jgi:hypothetical protein